MFDDLEMEIEDFHDISTQRQENLLAEIIRRGAKDKVGFQQYLQTLGYGDESDRHIFYEALWDNPKGWDDVIYEELVQLVKHAERNNEGALQEVSSLLYLTQLEDMTSDFYHKTLKFLLRKLNSPHADIRQYCAEGVLEVSDFGEIPLTTQHISALQRLLYDEVFDVRIDTYSNLKELNLLPADFKLSWLDKSRAKLTGKL